ncbi:MAG: helix-turn-helix domain-containing protein [Oscillospiraceae bacterium]|jgi:DNA-binding XRE family transcriptional regulator|nr:helix-turn-helix domain-containing protein [Oscillospiraceae bacterium]
MNKDHIKEIQQEYTEKLVKYMPELRQGIGVNQYAFARKLGISRSTMVYLESGSRKTGLTFHMYLAVIMIFMQYEDSRKLIEKYQLFDKDFIIQID